MSVQRLRTGPLLDDTNTCQQMAGVPPKHTRHQIATVLSCEPQSTKLFTLLTGNIPPVANYWTQEDTQRLHATYHAFLPAHSDHHIARLAACGEVCMQALLRKATTQPESPYEICSDTGPVRASFALGHYSCVFNGTYNLLITHPRSKKPREIDALLTSKDAKHCFFFDATVGTHDKRTQQQWFTWLHRQVQEITAHHVIVRMNAQTAAIKHDVGSPLIEMTLPCVHTLNTLLTAMGTYDGIFDDPTWNPAIHSLFQHALNLP